MDYKGYNLTDEQYDYISFAEKIDTKLKACAGSGKTQVLILKNIFLLENNIYNNNEILLLVFGRMAQNDIVNRAKQVDNNNLINKDLIMTIDSLSKYIIDDNNRIDVSLLSYKFMLYLQNTNGDDLKQNNKLNKIKCIFIDEAQDLNEIQYNILVLLKEKLDIVLNFIGDPNQNIFQFRNSESKYFINFKAKEFVLTVNFRSHTEIINFSNKLRPEQTHQIKSSKGYIDMKPTFYEGDFEFLLVNLIFELKEKSNLSDIAILSPVKGKIGINYSNGLCLVSNILSRYNIDFIQYYDESKEEVNNNNITYNPESNKIALMTICGSKGLQWKHVILIGMKTSLINYYCFTEKQHLDERNLLYVSSSRAIDTLSIIVEANKKSMSLNNWFGEIDSSDYEIHSENNFTELKFPTIKYNNEKLFDNRITRIIENIPLIELNNISIMLDYDNLEKNVNKIYDYTFNKIEYVSPIFLGKYTESLFVNLINMKNINPLKEYKDIKNIINSQNIIECDHQQTYEWILKNHLNMTWDKIDELKDVPAIIYNDLLIFKNKNKSNLKPFDKYTFILNNKYYIEFVKTHLNDITTFYNKYKSCNDFKKLKKLQFYCEIFHHAVSTQHYYHIRNKGNKFKSILKKYHDMFEQIKNYVNNMTHHFVKNNVLIENFNIIGEIDLINDNDELFEIKVAQDINLKYILQLLMYNILYNYDNCANKNTENYKLNFINFLKGEEITINLNLSLENRNKLIEIFQTYSWN
jgi:hypothetical protein